MFSKRYECGECGDEFYTLIGKNVHWDKNHSELEF